MDPSWQVAAGVAGVAGVSLAAGGLAMRNMLRPRAICGVPILRYRLVGRPLPGSILNDLRLPQSKFDAHMRHLHRCGFVPVTLAEAVRRRQDQSFLDAKPIVLTFDGPYAAFATSAWPVLCRYRLNRATLFFPAGYLGQTELVFNQGRAEPLLGPKALSLLVAEGVVLGVQAPVTRDDTEDVLLAEFRAARQVLGDFQGEAPGFVAFPFSTPAATSAAREAGFEGACILGDGVMRSSDSAFAIPRYAVQPDTEAIQLAMVIARRAGSSIY